MFWHLIWHIFWHVCSHIFCCVRFDTYSDMQNLTVYAFSSTYFYQNFVWISLWHLPWHSTWRIPTFYLRLFQAFYLTYCDILSDILTDIFPECIAVAKGSFFLGRGSGVKDGLRLIVRRCAEGNGCKGNVGAVVVVTVHFSRGTHWTSWLSGTKLVLHILYSRRLCA